MEIRRAIPGDRDVLLDVWLRSVRATHAFLSAAEIESLTPLVRDYLGSDAAEFWVVCDEIGAVMGFMGMSGSKMESLFLAPEFQRRGSPCSLFASDLPCMLIAAPGVFVEWG
jgi:putative acetyltransferase